MIKKSLSFIILLNIILLQCGFAFSQIIEDDVAIKSFQGQNLSKTVYKKEIIEDEAVLDFKDKNLSKPELKKVLLEDKFVENQSDIKKCVKQAVYYKVIDESVEVISIPICAIKLITTNEGLKIGQKVDFKISKDVYKNGEIFIKKDASVNAFIELISEAASYGDPDEIEIGRFSTIDTKGNSVNLAGIVKKQGANRAIWAKPLYYAGLSAPIFGAPLLLCYFVKGGKTHIKPEQIFQLYYE